MISSIRYILWRILGFDYQLLLRKTDFTLLRDDKYTSIGNGSYDNGAKVWRWSKAKLIIGNYCSIANNVNFIMDEGHHTQSLITNYPLHKRMNFNNNLSIEFSQKEGIVIGHDVWIGMGAYIMPGLKIGNGVTVAANSVVTKNIPDYHVVAGSPAKTIKIKHSEENINKLNTIAWWHWDNKTIENNITEFYLPIEQFIEKYNGK